MRLTLRTLLAYLEDALPAESARRMGRLISRSVAARRIIRRIRKVVRRRRLIAPKPGTERPGLDANEMAEYLDNVLPEDRVHRLERRCLKHNALLAEAAACHQILSRVLGEPPLVNDSARRRVYSALAITATTPSEVAVVGSLHSLDQRKQTATKEPVLQLPIPTVAAPDSLAGRVALGVLVALLFVALGVVLWRGLEPASIVLAERGQPSAGPAPGTGNEATNMPAATAAKDAAKEPTKESAGALGQDKKPQFLVAASTETRPSTSDSTTRTAPVRPVKKPPPPPKPANVAPAVEKPAEPLKAAEYIATRGVLCRLRSDGPERLQTGTPIMVGDVIANLDGWRSEIRLAGGHVLDLVDGAKLHVRGGPEPILEVQRGRAVLRTVDKPAIVWLGAGSENVSLTMSKPTSVATVEYLPPANVGGTETPSALLIGAVSNDLVVEHGGRKLTLPRGQVVDVGVGRGLGTAYQQETPVWLTGSQLGPADLKAADRLADRNAIPFGTRGVVESLSARVGDRVREVRKMAIRALASLEAYAAVVDALGDGQIADNRASALAALRPIAQGDQAGAEKIRQALLHTLPAEEAEVVLRLLRGYARNELADGRVVRQLLAALDSESLIMRELAIRNLQSAVGRDFGYSPTEPAVRRAGALKQIESFLRERR